MASTPKKKAKRTAISAKQKQLNSEYNKQVKRINQFVKRATGRGYYFFDEVVQKKINKRTKEPEVVLSTTAEKWELPKRPKKITEASIRKLKAITPDYLYKRALFTNPYTGEAMTGQEGKKYEQSRTAKRAAKTRKYNRIYSTNSDDEYEASDLWWDSETNDTDEGYTGRPARHIIAGTPSGNVYDYIFDEIMVMLQSLMPADDRYTKQGKLWVVDEARKSWSNVLVQSFLRIQEEVANQGELADYSIYLVFYASNISMLVERAKSTSKAEEVAANCRGVMKILNRGRDLEPHEADAVERYIMGEIDEI